MPQSFKQYLQASKRGPKRRLNARGGLISRVYTVDLRRGLVSQMGALVGLLKEIFEIYRKDDDRRPIAIYIRRLGNNDEIK